MEYRLFSLRQLKWCIKRVYDLKDVKQIVFSEMYDYFEKTC